MFAWACRVFAASSLAIVAPSCATSGGRPTPSAAWRKSLRATAAQVASSGRAAAAQPPTATALTGSFTGRETCGLAMASDPNMIFSLPGRQPTCETQITSRARPVQRYETGWNDFDGSFTASTRSGTVTHVATHGDARHGLETGATIEESPGWQPGGFFAVCSEMGQPAARASRS